MHDVCITINAQTCGFPNIYHPQNRTLRNGDKYLGTVKFMNQLPVRINIRMLHLLSSQIVDS